MSRQQIRASERKERKSKTKTYNFTKAQLEEYIKNAVEAELKNNNKVLFNNSVNTAMTLLLALPLEVLMDYYWPKSYSKRIPEFTNHVLEYYELWQNGKLDMDKLKEDLWEYGGVKFEEVEIK